MLYNKRCDKCEAMFPYSYKYCPFCTMTLEEVKLDEKQYPWVKEGEPIGNIMNECLNEIAKYEKEKRPRAVVSLSYGEGVDEKDKLCKWYLI